MPHIDGKSTEKQKTQEDSKTPLLTDYTPSETDGPTDTNKAKKDPKTEAHTITSWAENRFCHAPSSRKPTQPLFC